MNDVFLTDQPLLALTILSILVAVSAGMIAASRPAFALLLQRAGYVGLAAAGLLTVFHLIRDNDRSEAALWRGVEHRTRIEGKRTVIPQASDGHFWTSARINGEEARFLVDTGATYTTIGPDLARRARLALIGDETQPSGRILETANGSVVVTMARARSFAFGSISAHDLDIAVLSGNDSDLNVIGMNLLSRLATWQVENGELVLEPAQEESSIHDTNSP